MSYFKVLTLFRKHFCMQQNQKNFFFRVVQYTIKYRVPGVIRKLHMPSFFQKAVHQISLFLCPSIKYEGNSIPFFFTSNAKELSIESQQKKFSNPVKCGLFEKHTKFEKNLCLKVDVTQQWKIFSNFACFSESPIQSMIFCIIVKFRRSLGKNLDA